MAATTSLPLSARLTLDQFISYTGWNVPSLSHRQHMQVALDYFQDKIPQSDLRKPISDPSPWALPPGGVIKLSELMQAIEFSRPVSRLVLTCNTRLLAFLHADIGKHVRPRGNYYTILSTAQTNLAIPHNQQTEHVYAVESPVEVLKSTVADAYVDWTRKRKSLSAPPEYRHGSGIQIFIWNPENYLKHV